MDVQRAKHAHKDPGALIGEPSQVLELSSVHV